MIVAWKLIPRRHRGEAFSGEGARLAAGRWNARGIRAVYLSGSLSLAALEMLVYAGRASFRMPLTLFRVNIPEDVTVETLTKEKLPSNWKEQPPSDSTRRLGTDWIARGTAVALRVPSPLIAEDWNLLINPGHPDFSSLKISKPQVFRFV